MNARILLIQSDLVGRRRLETGLRAQGFAVSSVALAMEAFETCRRVNPDAIVIGPDTPDMSGLSFLAALRRMVDCRDVAALLSLPSGYANSALKAFEFGADDCVAETMDVRELGARLDAAMRRRKERASLIGAPIRCGDIRLAPSRRTCHVGRKLLSLRPREFALLEMLMRRPGRVLSRPYLLESVWGMSSEASTRAVDISVSRLRRQLGACGRLIETVLKAGYRLRRPC